MKNGRLDSTVRSPPLVTSNDFNGTLFRSESLAFPFAPLGLVILDGLKSKAERPSCSFEPFAGVLAKHGKTGLSAKDRLFVDDPLVFRGEAFVILADL